MVFNTGIFMEIEARGDGKELVFNAGVENLIDFGSRMALASTRGC